MPEQRQPKVALMAFARNSLHAIIANIESGNNQFAIRFEPGVYLKAQVQSRFAPMIEAARQANNCTRHTAIILISTSFGAFQIMGFNLYDASGLNYPFSVGQFMSDPEAQEMLFREFCEKREIYYTFEELKNNPAAVLRFAKIYNGDAAAYGYKINKRLETV